MMSTDRSPDEKLYSVALRLQVLSTAFATTGNFSMAKQLDTLADDIRSAHEGMRGEYRRLMVDHIAGVSQTSATLLAATMAGVTLGQANPSSPLPDLA